MSTTLATGTAEYSPLSNVTIGFIYVYEMEDQAGTVRNSWLRLHILLRTRGHAHRGKLVKIMFPSSSISGSISLAFLINLY